MRKLLIDDENFSEDVLPWKVNTNELFQKAFNFVEVSKFDFSVE